MLIRDRDGEFRISGTADLLKVAKWVGEDLPLSQPLGFAVHRRVERAGRYVFVGQQAS
jgi:hypothetical protein